MSQGIRIPLDLIRQLGVIIDKMDADDGIHIPPPSSRRLVDCSRTLLRSSLVAITIQSSFSFGINTLLRLHNVSVSVSVL